MEINFSNLFSSHIIIHIPYAWKIGNFAKYAHKGHFGHFLKVNYTLCVINVSFMSLTSCMEYTWLKILVQHMIKGLANSKQDAMC